MRYRASFCRLITILAAALLMIPGEAGFAQSTGAFTPTPVAAYLTNGSTYTPWAEGTGQSPLPVAPVAIGLFCQTPSSTEWTPCNPQEGTFSPTGAWSSVTNYTTGQVVTYNNILYYSLLPGNLNQIPSASTTWWSALALAPGSIGQPIVNLTTGESLPVSFNLAVVMTGTSDTALVLPAGTNWPICPSSVANSCPTYIIKDGGGNSTTYPITITTVDGKLIDGLTSYIINGNYNSVHLTFNGTAWFVF